MQAKSPLIVYLVGVASLWTCSASAQVGASTQPPPAAAALSATTRKVVQEAQQRLQILGYEPGTPDGVMGSRSIAALKKFQSDHGLPVTGALDRKTLDSLSVTGVSRTVPTSSPTSPGLLPSEDLIIKDVTETEFKGTVSVSAADADCRRVMFNVEATYTSKGGLPGAFGVFYPGLTFRFAGHSCIPAKTAQFNARYDVRTEPGPGASMGLSEGRLVSSGPMVARGTVSMAMSDDAAVIDFNASPADPLVFQLTKDGYQYISGTGTVKLPGRKVQAFPEK